MKNIQTYLIIGLVLSTFGCTELKDINSEKTDLHVNIPGTKLFIIQPSGFKMSNEASASIKEKTASIIAIEFSGISYNNCSELNLTKQNFEEKKIEVLEYKEFFVNEFPAKFAYLKGYVKEKPTAKSYYVVFGDSTFCTAIIGIFNEGDKTSQEQIKSAFESIFYDKTAKIDLSFKMNGFKLDDSNSIMKFTTYAGGVGIFTKNGEDNAEAYPMLTVNKVPNNKTYNVNTINEIYINNLRNTNFTDIITKSQTKSIINGLETFESVNFGTMYGEKYLIYVLTVSIDDFFVILTGNAKNDYEKSLAEIRQLSNTIEKSTRP